jgi:peptidoglycan/xylan/chitin deacetylase (PgdA/CDA1 family)
MRLLSPILHRMVYPALGRMGYFHSRFAPSAMLNVVTYHGVLPVGYKSRYPPLDNTLVELESFRSQLRLLKKHYHVISPDRFLRWLRNQEDLPSRAVLLTCDDGLLNHFELMLPALQKEGLKCLFFVTGTSLRDTACDTSEILWYMELYLMLMEAPVQDGPLVLCWIPIPRIPADPAQREAIWQELMKTLSRLDAAGRREFMEEAAPKLGLHPAWKARQLEDPVFRSRFQLLRLPELRQLTDAGMTVGAHTLSHPMLAEQSPELVRIEILECRRVMEQCLGQQVWAIAFPFGTSSSAGDREYKWAEEAGYECAFLNVGGSLQAASPRFALPRIHVTGEMSLEDYEAHISGFHDALQDRFGL